MKLIKRLFKPNSKKYKFKFVFESLSFPGFRMALKAETENRKRIYTIVHIDETQRIEMRYTRSQVEQLSRLINHILETD